MRVMNYIEIYPTLFLEKFLIKLIEITKVFEILIFT